MGKRPFHQEVEHSIAFSQAVLRVLLDGNRYTLEQIACYAQVRKDELEAVCKGTRPLTTAQVVRIEKACGEPVARMAMQLRAESIGDDQRRARYDAAQRLLAESQRLRERLTRDD